ncbi:hypothetical protein C1I97_00510 [Streptomyces sp. NTH33]|uniref:hypothetical protein n=1 Tax=Streptomyces sp. NTH33 TaxID=1735453 RepID=UPI000DAA2388|nr:hypothetical protein [Streptomyces sp. NTH33]PZH21036.1 hypothetical protein C1I97_00510 [Streptomyces sp. NTH33]
MINVKSLVTRANPLPDTAPDNLSARASEELTAPLGSTPVTRREAREGRGTREGRRPRGTSRRGVLAGAVACTAAAVVAVVTGSVFFALDAPKAPEGVEQLADEPDYGTTAELENVADLIVRVRLSAGREEPVDGIVMTVATAQVTATAKGGDSSDRSIEVLYPTPGFSSETADLTAGKEYVLLLGTLDGERFTLVNTAQGAYRVENGHAVASDVNDVALSPGVLQALRLTP